MKLKIANDTFSLNPTFLFNGRSYRAFTSRGYNRYSALFWSVFGPADRYSFGMDYRYAY